MQTVNALWRLTEGARVPYGLAILAMVASTVLLYLSPLVAQAVLDGVLSDAEPTWLVSTTLSVMGGREFVASRLWVAALWIVGLTSVAGVFTYFQQRWSAVASQTVVRALRDRVYDHLQRLPCTWFDERETGDLVQRCTSDVDTVQVFLATHVVEIGRALVMFLVPLPLMIAIDWRMTLMSTLVIPVIVAFSWVFFVRVRDAFTHKDEAEAAMTTVVQENLTGIRVVRAFGRAPFEQTRFAEKNQAHRTLDARLYDLMAAFWSASDLLTFVQIALVLGAGVYFLTQGELEVGAFFYFLTAVGMFVFPLRQMGRIVADLGKATVALGRLDEVLGVTQEDADGEAPITEGAIRFDDVSFAYGTGLPALKNVSLTIPPRSTVAFVGPSGSGKTTLIALLMRLYDPTSGEIRIDGRPLSELGRRAMRRQLAVVMQQPFLFSKTLRENLVLGRAEATDDELVAVTRIADVHETIERFDAGYETEVGERGVTLSGGQRQRVALARALLQKPAILVLDDALSAVDTHTESAILDRLAERSGRQTTLLIAHRLSTVALADRIFVLDEGQLVQSGTHAELLRESGPYARLWALQTQGAAHALR